MTLREKMEKSYDSMDCCKAVRLLDGKIVAVLHEGKIEGIEIDGSERTVTPELIHSIAVVVNDCYDCYDCYGGWDDTHILLDTDPPEMPCCKCPWFGVCAVMDEENDEAMDQLHEASDAEIAEYGVYDSPVDPDIVALAEMIRASDIWVLEDVKKLCIAAGMESEWESADGDTFESVAQEAADRLGVEIY